MDRNRTTDAGARNRALAALASETAAVAVDEKKVTRAIEEASEALAILSGVFGQMKNSSDLDLSPALGSGLDDLGGGSHWDLSQTRRGLARLGKSVRRVCELCAEAGVPVVLPTLPLPVARRNGWSRALVDFVFSVLRSDHRAERLRDDAHAYRRGIDAALIELQRKRRTLARTRIELAARQARLSDDL
jgi:hypothetical protein